MKRYKDYMDGVEVSDALHEKLNNLEQPKKKPQPWAKWGGLAAALVLAAGVGAWGLSRGGWNAVMENFKPDAEVEPGIADIPAPFPMPDIATVNPMSPPNDPDAVTDRTNGGYEVIDGEFAAYYVLPWLEWVDAYALPQNSMDYTLAPPGAIDREATWDDILLFMGGEKAMADHLLWNGLDWSGTISFLEDGTPCAALLYAEGNGLSLSLEIMLDYNIPSCVALPVEYYVTSQWQGTRITTVKNGGRAIIDGAELNEMREISFFFNGAGYKLTLYAANADLADELCGRFVRYAVDGGFSLSVLPFRAGDLPNKGTPPEDMPTANILHPGDPGYVEPFPAPDGVSDEDSAPWTTPYNPNMAAEAKAPTPSN